MSKGKKIKMKWKNGTCEVEKYTDGNKKKKRVFFCTDCKANMCKPCSSNVVKRFMAMINRDIERMGKQLNKKI